MVKRAKGAPALCRCLAGLAAFGALALACDRGSAAPERPSDDALVLAIVSSGRSSASSDLRDAMADLARRPKDLRLAVPVARLAIEEGRARADPRRYGQAEAALAPWWAEANPPDEVRVLRAVILQARHDFPAALSDLDAMLSRYPQNAQARLSRAFVRMVTGDLGGAAEDCRAMPPDAAMLAAALCRARVEALTGSAPRAFVDLAGALDRDGGADGTMRRFAVSALADIAAGLGHRDAADQLFADAATIGVPDVPLLVATADHLLQTDRPAEALRLLDAQGDADGLVLRRAIAARRIGDARLDDWAAILNERFAAARAAGTNLHLREEARFRLEVEGDAATALLLALENWRIQKEPADAHLVLDAAVAAGEPAAAGEVVRFVRNAGWVDARLTPLLQVIAGPRS